MRLYSRLTDAPALSAYTIVGDVLEGDLRIVVHVLTHLIFPEGVGYFGIRYEY